jgi:RNA ligase
MKVDLAKLQPFIDEKYISVRKHPEEDLWIYDYTQNCQFEKKWTPETMMCRGLILDAEGNVIARPFDKFFNQEENLVSHKGTFVAFDKMDGSMGILYPHAGGTKLSIATRGSFVSDQAIEGTKMLQHYIDSRDIKARLLKESKTKTYLFEIIYPENRIVVDYQGKRELILLAIRDIETGEVFRGEKEIFTNPLEITDFKTPRDNAEGVVLYYDDGFMEKCKYSEYVWLHRLVTGVTARRIWDILRNHQDAELAELTTRVPEEFKSWVEKTTIDLKKQYDGIEWVCSKISNSVGHLESRKEKAKIIKLSDYPGVIFKMIDDGDYEPLIWKLLKPKAEKPYREDL